MEENSKGTNLSNVIPQGQKTGPADAASRRLSMIVAQKPTQSIAAPHRPLALPIVCPRKQQDVTLPLMISLGMEMVDIVAQLWLLKNLSRRSTAFQSDMLLAEWSMF
jgi:hypothetical protein